MRRSTFALAAATLLAAGAAQAHPKVLSTTPATGGTVAGAPADIRISFSEPVFPKLSGVEIRAPSGAAVKTGAARVDPKNKKLLIVPVAGKLAPGHYVAAWHAVSTDTHHVNGQFDFTVK